MSKQPVIISFDGNIGSGKSTIVKYFEEKFEKFCKERNINYKICFLPEPVSIWESIKDEYNKNAIEFYKHLGFKMFSKHSFLLGNDNQTDLLLKINI